MIAHETRAPTSPEWYTPAWLMAAIGLEFDLDPCHPHDRVLEHIPAPRRYTVFDDGLKQPWHGRVWCNPPYGPRVGRWLDRMAAHGHGIALVYARTDTAWCQAALESAGMALFLRGRVPFLCGTDGKPRDRGGAGSLLLAWGADCEHALQEMAPTYGVTLVRP
jgi:hypothetical protein